MFKLCYTDEQIVGQNDGWMDIGWVDGHIDRQTGTRASIDRSENTN